MKVSGILVAILLLLVPSCTRSRPYARAWIIGPDDEIVRSRSETPWEHKTRKLLLSKRVTFSFQATPLSESLKELSEKTGLVFVVAPMESKDPPVTLHVEDMVLSNALDWITTLVDAKWGMKDRAIHIGKDIEHPFHDGRPRVPLETWKKQVDAMLKKEEFRDKKISFFFQDTELSKVFAFISDVVDLDTVPVFDRDRLDPVVTLRVKKMALRNAFDWLFTLLQSAE
jgi:hypothetical protein